MSVSPALQLAALAALGFCAQWLAWRMRLPAILFLLLLGLVLGPGLDWLDPDAAMGPLLFPFVTLGVAIILFEGAASLRFDELAGVGGTVSRLVTVGALVTVLVLAAAAHWIAGLPWELAALFGALTCVTGPTVIMPMLRSVRPNARISNVLRWEGIVIDPLGALLAVLVYEAIVSHQDGHSLRVFGFTILAGAGCGAVGAAVLAFLLRRNWLPEYLQTYGTLSVLLLTFTTSNELAHESGLLAVTVMGIVLANLRGLAIEEILSFKEHLSTLLISALFILLAARLRWPLPPGALLAGVLILLVAQIVARPLAVLASSVGGSLSWRERALVAWIAPRGIVAAAVSALFSLRLESQGIEGADMLVPLTFALIIGTVVLQSATAGPLARWLGVAEPEPRGVLVIGANRVARTVSQALVEQGVQVLVADDDWPDIQAARMAGLPVWYGDPLSEHAERTLPLDGLGRLFAMSTRREHNSLACVRYRPEFGRHRVYRLRVLEVAADGDRRREQSETIRADRLFGKDVTLGAFERKLDEGWRIKSTRLSETFGVDAFRKTHGADALVLFCVDEQGRLRVASEARKLEAKPGCSLTALVPPAAAT
ncbi:MAG: sodium:proton antiporter [Lysobacteraceae bacterium]|nr:MAG: sodium:proton antiporter [Xanthomonadaceae bacterium]